MNGVIFQDKPNAESFFNSLSSESVCGFSDHSVVVFEFNTELSNAQKKAKKYGGFCFNRKTIERCLKNLSYIMCEKGKLKNAIEDVLIRWLQTNNSISLITLVNTVSYQHQMSTEYLLTRTIGCLKTA